MIREEAIRIIEANCSCSESKLREACAMFIPELRESDDERIRKALIDGVRQIRCKNGITQEQMIAYLEKQKEQKQTDLPAGFYYIDLDGNKYYSKEFRYGDFKMKIAEPKPAWSEEDELMRERCIADLGYLMAYEPQYKERYDAQIKWLKSLFEKIK